MKPTIPLSRALAGTVALAILAGLVPAGIVLDGRLQASLEAKARTDLELAPRLLDSRNSAFADAMMMHAKEFAHSPGLAEALVEASAGRGAARLLAVVEGARASLGESIPLVVGGDGRMLLGPQPDLAMIARTRGGEMPVKLCTDGQMVRNVALAPVVIDGRWIGAAGLAAPLDDQQALALAGLTRSGVVVVSALTDSITATTIDSTVARALFRELRSAGTTNTSREVLLDGERYITVSASLDDAGRVFFVRRMRDELALLPSLRRTAGLSAAAAVALALLLGIVSQAMQTFQKLPASGDEREALRTKGQFWTPPWLAKVMAAWVTQDRPKVLFDPAVGPGTFFAAARELGFTGELHGHELHSNAFADGWKLGLKPDIALVMEH